MPVSGDYQCRYDKIGCLPAYCHGNAGTQHKPAEMLLESTLRVSLDGYPVGNLKTFKELTISPHRNKVSAGNVAV